MVFFFFLLDDGEWEFDRDFFIKCDKDVLWVDEDFWECGFVVGDEGWFLWMGDEIGVMVMEVGKV